MASIYNISSDLKKIYEDLDNGNGIDLETGEIKPEIMQQLSISRNELEVKAVDYGYVIKAFDDEICIIEKEIERLEERKAYVKKNKEKMKQIVSSAMEEFGITKIKGDTLQLSFRKSEIVEVFDENLLNEKFKKSHCTFCQYPAFWYTKHYTDKTAIKNAIKNGENVQGAKIIEKNNLQIK